MVKTYFSESFLKFICLNNFQVLLKIEFLKIINHKSETIYFGFFETKEKTPRGISFEIACSSKEIVRTIFTCCEKHSFCKTKTIWKLGF